MSHRAQSPPLTNPRPPPPPATKNASYRYFNYPSYQSWLTDAGIVAPKVQVVGWCVEENRGVSGDRAKDDGGADESCEHRQNSRPRVHRGLYSTEAIAPGERIVYIPSAACIGERMLRERGSELLAQGGFRGGADDPAVDVTTKVVPAAIDDEAGPGSQQLTDDAKRRVMENQAIAMIEQIRRLSRHNKFPGYRWKSDDGVALFLISCRKILEVVPLRHTLNTSQSSSDASSTKDRGDDASGDTIAAPATDGASPRSFISFVPHVAILPHSFPTNRLYYTPDELKRQEMTAGITTGDAIMKKKGATQSSSTNHRAVPTDTQQEPRQHNYVPTQTDVLKQIQYDCSELQGVVRAYNDGRDGATGGEFVLDPDEDLSLDSYKWALSNIGSRQTDFQPEEEAEAPSESAEGGDDKNCGEWKSPQPLCTVIVPLLDMMNHDFASNVTHSMDAHGNISVFNGGKETIPPQTEININYGSFPNKKRLLVNGFFFFFSSQS